MEDYPDLSSSMKDVVTELIAKNIATKNEDGSVGVVFPDEMNIPSCILQKRDGTHGYLASDLASVKYRMDNWNPKKILYFVDVRQQLHLKQAFVISKMAGWINASTTEITHAHNGFISLKDGAMSTRKGKIIKLEKLLDEAEKKAAEIIQAKRDDISGDALESLSRIIGVGAIKYGYLKKSRTSDSIFDWDEYMSFE
jgi:arginyl-tRNA synthetase